MWPARRQRVWIPGQATLFLSSDEDLHDTPERRALPLADDAFAITPRALLDQMPSFMRVGIEHIPALFTALGILFTFWCRQLLRYLEIQAFFVRVGDNERLEFWADYLPRVTDLVQDTENLRLFLDFGGFGVIEFGEVGNAAYVYREKYFETYMHNQKSGRYRDSAHSDLKDKNCGEAFRHNIGWQRRFRHRLNILLTLYGN